MKKMILVTLMLLITANIILAKTEPELFSTKFVKGKYGLVNSSGKLILAAEYDKIEQFINVDKSVNFFVAGLCKVLKKSKYGLVNNKGKIIVPFIYDEILTPYDKVIPVKKDNKWSIINNKGETLVDSMFTEFKPFEYPAMAS